MDHKACPQRPNPVPKEIWDKNYDSFAKDYDGILRVPGRAAVENIPVWKAFIIMYNKGVFYNGNSGADIENISKGSSKGDAKRGRHSSGSSNGMDSS